MERVALGQTGRQTTRLGFGCTGLLGILDRRESLAALEAAFDAGVRHFDVAPLYGFGQAESCLGEFLARHPGEATVATKYGIAAPSRQSLLGAARGLAKPIVRLLPGMKAKLGRAAARVAKPIQRPFFQPKPAQESLDLSLRALRTDHIDLWLLHEVQTSDLDGSPGDDFLEFLGRTVASGKIGSFGIGSGREKVTALVAAHPAFCATRQYEWSVLDPVPPEDGAFRLHHRALTDNFRALHAAFSSHAETAARWSARVGVDLHNSEKLAELMLAAALVLNPASVILFSSKNLKHIAANARLAEGLSRNGPLPAAARNFYSLIQQDEAALLNLVGSRGLDAVRVQV